MLEKLYACHWCYLRSIFESSMMCERQADEKLEPIHIATAFIDLKSRQHPANNCIEDILALLHILSINVSSSYKALRACIEKSSSTHISPSTHTIYPHCQNLSSETHQCTTCGASYSPISPLNNSLFYTSNISEQLNNILTTSQDLLLHNNSAFRKKRNERYY